MQAALESETAQRLADAGAALQQSQQLQSQLDQLQQQHQVLQAEKAAVEASSAQKARDAEDVREALAAQAAQAQARITSDLQAAQSQLTAAQEQHAAEVKELQTRWAASPLLRWSGHHLPRSATFCTLKPCRKTQCLQCHTPCAPD
jgi:hypothetical protein